MSQLLIDKIPEYRKLYMDTLFNDVVPFWVRNSPDSEFGGYFTCLDKHGTLLSLLMLSQFATQYLVPPECFVILLPLELTATDILPLQVRYSIPTNLCGS
jgi:hypothetical protein